jgi:carbonyl reductase 1
LIDVVLQLQINNAGIANANKDVTFETVKPVLNTNYFGVKNVTKALLPLLRDDTPGGARVIVVASRAGQLMVMSLGIPTPHQLISGHLICT